ncbi:tumor necrosis factor receptor superfamily member 1A, partial [Dipodomys spectabilis]|uniref:tumor necrosis factor receptor superfamily member 1A n=1 Tax=Dipodomys spectabilis TaxID=105255 RepID=UPI001C54B975
VLLALLVGIHLSIVSGLVLPLEGRGKRDSLCPPGKYVHPQNSSICCTMCHKGTYLFKDCPRPGIETECRVCEKGSFTAFENHQRECHGCSQCRLELNQVELSPCTVDRDTECGCGKNQFRYYLGAKPFECRACSLCLNGSVIFPCQESQDTVCSCHVGFFPRKSECVPCSDCKERHECTKLCLPPSQETVSSHQDSGATVLLPLVIFLALCLAGSFFLTLLCRRPRWKSKFHSILCGTPVPVKEGELEGMNTKPPASAPAVCVTPNFSPPSGPPFPSSPNPTFPPSDRSWAGWPPKEGAPPHLRAELLLPSPPLPTTPLQATPLPATPTQTTPLPATPTQATPLPAAAARRGDPPGPDDPAVLYAVVDGVPPSRWKELVRRLGLSEHQIELLELQHGRCLREAHYSMLEAWRMRAPRPAALLDLLAGPLDAMDLRGCLENIRETLRAQGRLR